MDDVFHEGPDDRQLFEEKESEMHVETSELKWTISDPADKLFEALSKAQGKIGNASKDALNPHFKSKYADLASVWDACRAPLSENGLCVIQIPASEGQLVSVVTILGHASGQKMSCELSATARAADPQAGGSVLTYLKRYSLSSVAGVAPEDDDANAGTGSPEEHRQPVRRETSEGDRREYRRQQSSGEETQAAPKEPPPVDATKPKVNKVFEAVRTRLHEIGCQNIDEANAVIRFVVGTEEHGGYKWATLEHVKNDPAAPAAVILALGKAKERNMPDERILHDARELAALLKPEGATA